MAPQPEANPHPARGAGSAAGIALFGGTFNPPHRTHARIAATALQQLPLAELVVLPSGEHPWKRLDPELAPAEERLALARIAFAELPGVRVDDYEVRLAEPSFTVATLRHFRSRFGPGVPLFWVLGSDNLGEFPKWREARTILELAEIAVYPRLGFPCTEDAARAAGFRPAEAARLLAHPLVMTPDATSSSAIRRLLASGGDATAWLDPRVLARIRERHLYGT